MAWLWKLICDAVIARAYQASAACRLGVSTIASARPARTGWGARSSWSATASSVGAPEDSGAGVGERVALRQAVVVASGRTTWRPLPAAYDDGVVRRDDSPDEARDDTDVGDVSVGPARHQV